MLPGLGLFGVGLFGVGLFRVGLGLAFAASTIAATAGVKAHDQGLASGLLTASKQVGFAIGVAALVTVAVSRTTRLPTGDLVERLLSGYHPGLWVAAGLSLLAIPGTMSIARAPKP